MEEKLILLLSCFYVNYMHRIKRLLTPLFLVLLIVITPLVYSEKTVDINFAPQFFFHGITCVTFLLFAWLMNGVKKLTMPLNALTFIIATYIVIIALSVLFAPYQQEGIIEIYKLLSWVLLILILYQLFQVQDHILMMLKSMVVIGFVLSLIGFLQLTKIAFTELPGNVIPYGTLGNRNIFIPAILILLPFNICMLSITTDFKWRLFASFSGGLIVIVIVWGLMRTALLAIILALILNLLLMILMQNKVKQFLQQFKFLKAISLIIITATLIIVGYYYFQQLKLKNDKESALFSFNSTEERTVLWERSLQMVKDYPYTGVGAGNWKIMLPNYGLSGLPPEARKAALFYLRPENDFLWAFAETGIIGGLAYIGIFIIAAMACIRKINIAKEKKEKLMAFAVLNALILYGVTAFFSFPKDRIYLHIELAIIISLALLFVEQKTLSKKLIQFPVFTVLTVFILFTWKGSKLFAAEKKLSKLLAARTENQHQEVLDATESIVKNNYLMDQTTTPICFYEGVAYFGLQNLDQALISFHKAEALHPYHLHVLNNLATCYSIKGDFNKSIAYLNEAIRISPDFQEAIINLAGLHYNNRNYKEAYKYFFMASKDNTQNALYVNLDGIISKTINDSLIRVTQSYIDLGELVKAENSLKGMLHKSKWPQYHDLQVAIIRKRQQMSLLKN